MPPATLYALKWEMCVCGGRRKRSVCLGVSVGPTIRCPVISRSPCDSSCRYS
ncbi:hypothetical protein E2C01_101364 [Portunus trituberculatus]|uniref:Uncharacterized protein n=1 Tax=Portunus trituberculatus TaxID=210409 RepID=A0A5B7K5I6_PORTR|nr:hypothetical protein [Portunus trituberculatus]